MKYEKGEKITFVEAIQLMERGLICYGVTDDLLHKNENRLYKKGINNIAFLSNDTWIDDNYSFRYLYNLKWYTAKEIEEKFDPSTLTEEQLFGWWYHKNSESFITMNVGGVNGVIDSLEKGWRPITPEIRKKFLEQVKKELRK